MITNPTWTLRGLLGALVRIVPAYVVLLVSDIEAIWTKRYGTEQDAVSRRTARLWTVLACAIYVATILALWGVSNMSAVHFVRLLETCDFDPPPVTHLLINTARFGWVLLFLVPLLGVGLFQLRIRGGVASTYADVAHGFIMLAFALFGAVLGLGALAFVPIIFPVD